MEISPSLLEFKGDFRKASTEYLTLTNSSNGPLAFKVKTTAPKLYCVRPNASTIEPGTSQKVSIILQSFSQPLPKDYKCKDKFLIVSLPCPEGTDPSKAADIWPTLEKNNKSEIVSKKLRVNYVIEDSEEPAAEPVVSEEHDEPSEKAVASGVETGATSATIANIRKVVEPEPEDEKLDESISQINQLSRKLDQSQEPEERAVSATKSEESFGGVSLPTTVVLMLLAFLIGWLIF